MAVLGRWTAGGRTSGTRARPGSRRALHEETHMSSSALTRSRTRPSVRVGSGDGSAPGPGALRTVAADDGRVEALELEVAQLRNAMASRAVIEQAKGVLMLLTGCADQAAFDLLTHISSHTHRKVREIAQELVGSATGRDPLPADVKEILRDACPPSHPLS
jgi:hypothetical protein